MELKKESKKTVFNNFHQYLNNSLATHQKLLLENNFKWGELLTIYLGGGTPSLWGSHGANFFNTYLSKIALKHKSCEWTIEVNPKAWTESNLNSWEKAGVNRFSIGVQSMDDRFLKLLGRLHNQQDVYNTLQRFDNLKSNFSIDLMLGIPKSKQLRRNIIKELEQLLHYNPKHISVYILTPKANYQYTNLLPDDEWTAQEYLSVATYLKSKGFLHYEVSNFAIAGYESKHNLKYWNSESVAAFGPTSTGLLRNQHAAIRYQWQQNTEEFRLEHLTWQQLRLEEIYLKLRTSRGLDFSTYFNKNECIGLSALFSQWNKAGYLLGSSAHYQITLTSKGYLVLDFLMNDLFKILKKL